LHKLTTKLVLENSIIGIENLNIDGMLKNHKLAAKIQDLGWYEFKRQLLYKASWYGSFVHEADRFYASTKTCSNCGHVQDMPLRKRTYDCSCGMSIDRDLNAALNLMKVAAGAAETINACGETCSGSDHMIAMKQGSLNQEVSMRQLNKAHRNVLEHV